MFKYFQLIRFLVVHDLTELKEYWQSEILRNKKFKWRRLIRSYFSTSKIGYRYLVWWRIANLMHSKGDRAQVAASRRLQVKLISKYNIEIGLGAKIGKNFSIYHCHGTIITPEVKIGDNFNIRQNTTIGLKTIPHFKGDKRRAKEYLIEIGDNVFIGANTTILGDRLTIGKNVVIGAMSFINKNIPDNSTVYTQKSNIIVENKWGES